MRICHETERIWDVDIPHFSQLDNDSDHNSGPLNECSFTCMAMFLRSLGFVGNGDGQFEDQIERLSEALGHTRGEPYAMSELMNDHFYHADYQYKFTPAATWDDLRSDLLKGLPSILHTWLTGSGHVIVYRGWNDDAYGGYGANIFNDPYGEWCPGGYDTGASGEGVEYSYSLSKRLIGIDGDLWAHRIISR